MHGTRPLLFHRRVSLTHPHYHCNLAAQDGVTRRNRCWNRQSKGAVVFAKVERVNVIVVCAQLMQLFSSGWIPNLDLAR